MNKAHTPKTISALVLNLLLPGLGYIYLGAKNRMLVAIALLLLSIYQIGYISFVFFTGSHYSYSQNLSPFAQTGLVSINVYSLLVLFVMSIDTYLVGRELT